MISSWWPRDDLRRRFALSALVYAVTSAAYFACAAPVVLFEHTDFNHYALLARAWLDGELHLSGPPPAYAQNNDFATYQGRWFVVFPPFPALLLVPLVALAGDVERVPDGQFFLWLAGVGPAVTFLALEKLRRFELSKRSVEANLALALLLGCGSVYFFSAVQGTVWFAAHVVAVALAALYLLFALGAERPLLAGAMLALGAATRTPLLFAFPLFVAEALRTSLRAPGAVETGGIVARMASSWRRLDAARAARLLASFAIPVLVVGAALAWHNAARFGDAFDFGYEHLAIRWQERIQRWGLFHYHYLARNLGVIITSLPWWTPNGAVPFQINAHGLALWFTTPLYLWALWPRWMPPPYRALAVTALAVGLPTLFYQNTGWVQFGYRFSNDYAVFLFALLALGGRRFGGSFWALAAWSVLVNGFGALTFDRAEHRDFYYFERTQRVLHQPD